MSSETVIERVSIAATVWTVIMLLIALLLVIASFYFINASDEENKWKNKANLLTLIVVILFFISSICGLIGFPVEMSYGEDSSIWVVLVICTDSRLSFTDTQTQNSV